MNSSSEIRVSENRIGDIRIRKALPSEVAVVLRHRRLMFRDMGEGTVEQLDQMVAVATPWTETAMAAGSYHHWFAVSGPDSGSSLIAGGGGVLLCPWPANPRDPCVERAVILNVYTEQEFRRRGIARLVMAAIIDWVKQRGLRSVNLHASPEGRALYEKLGFQPTNEMRLWLDALQQDQPV